VRGRNALGSAPDPFAHAAAEAFSIAAGIFFDLYPVARSSRRGPVDAQAFE
jgi:hypothetical protein